MRRLPGILLTGGTSSRMGIDKASLVIDGESLAARAGRVLAEVCDPVIEVGPGLSGLYAIADDIPATGPLGGLLKGTSALGVLGPVLLFACDMPAVSSDTLRSIANYVGVGTVVPVDRAGVRQVVCARYSVAALERGAALLAAGSFSLQALADLPDAVIADEWSENDCWADVDTPADAHHFGIHLPG